MQKISFKNFVNQKDPDLLRKIEDESVLNEILGSLVSAGKSIAGAVTSAAGSVAGSGNQQTNLQSKLQGILNANRKPEEQNAPQDPVTVLTPAQAKEIKQQIAIIAAHKKPHRTFNAMNTLFTNEINDVNIVQKRNVIGQAEYDKELHDNVQGTNRFSDEAKAFLDEDKKLKTAFQEIMKGNLLTPDKKQISSAYVQKIINGLESDKNTHKYYLNQPQDQNTGSYGWQNHWISVYDGWIKKLGEVKQILSKYKI